MSGEHTNKPAPLSEDLVSKLRQYAARVRSGAMTDDAVALDMELRQAADKIEAFKNFHRLLCERFDYAHDEKDWERDQISLIEWIAKRYSRDEMLRVYQSLKETTG